MNLFGINFSIPNPIVAMVGVHMPGTTSLIGQFIIQSQRSRFSGLAVAGTYGG